MFSITGHGAARHTNTLLQQNCHRLFTPCRIAMYHVVVVRTWQGDALHGVTHLARWRTAWCDALGKVTHLTKWRILEGDPRDSGDALDRKRQAWREFKVITDFTTFTAPEFRWLTDETINYWQLTLAMTNLLIPYFTEAEFIFDCD